MFISCEHNTIINLKYVRKIWICNLSGSPNAQFKFISPFKVSLETDNNAKVHIIKSFEKEEDAIDFYDSIRRKLDDMGHFCQ